MKELFNNLGIRVTKPEVANFFLNTIKQTVAYREQNNIERKDMLDLLIKLKNNQSIDEDIDSETNESFTFNELAAQCFVFFLAGFETSSTTMSFALLELSQNQDIQDKLREEIRMIYKKYNGQLTYEAVMEMTYMDKVIHGNIYFSFWFLVQFKNGKIIRVKLKISTELYFVITNIKSKVPIDTT